MVRLTKAMKHKNEILEFLENLPNATVDQWGNIRRPEERLDHGEIEIVQIKYKVKKTALRKEVKYATDKTWYKIWSAYFKDLKLEDGKLKILKTM